MRWMWTLLASAFMLLPVAASADDKEEKERPLPPGKAAVLRLKGALKQMKAEGKSDSEILQALQGMLDRATAVAPEGPPVKGPPAKVPPGVKSPPAVKAHARGKVFPLLTPRDKGEKPKVEKAKVEKPRVKKLEIKGPPGKEKPPKVELVKGEKPKVKALKEKKQLKVMKPQVKQPKLLKKQAPAKVKKAGEALPAAKARAWPFQRPYPFARARAARKGPGALWMQKLLPALRGHRSGHHRPGPRCPWAPWTPPGRGPAWGPCGPRAAWGQPAAPAQRPGRGPGGPWFAPAPRGGAGAALMPQKRAKTSPPPKAAPAALPRAAERIRAAVQKLRAEGKSPQEIRDAVQKMKERLRETLKEAARKKPAQK